MTQDLLVMSQNMQLSEEAQEALIRHIKMVGADFEKVADEHDIDLIVGPVERRLLQYAAANGRITIQMRSR